MLSIAAHASSWRCFAQENGCELLRGRRERPVLPVDEIEFSRDAHLPQPHLVQDSSLDLPLNAHPRHDGHALLHLDKQLDAFDGRQLDIHAQRDMMAREHLHDALRGRETSRCGR